MLIDCICKKPGEMNVYFVYTIQYTLESFRAFPVHSEQFLAIKWISTGSLGGHLIIKNSISTFYYISFAKKCFT